MNEDLIKIKKQLLDYIHLILKEYPNCNRKEIADIINNDKEMVYYYYLKLLIKFFHYLKIMKIMEQN